MDISKIKFLNKNKPTVVSDIERLESAGGIILLEVYKELLLLVNGFCTFGTIVIYGTDDILERYQTLEVGEYSKGYVAIGDNSGPDVFLMKQDKYTHEVFITDVGYMNALDPNGKILNFKRWVEAGCPDIYIKPYNKKWKDAFLKDLKRKSRIKVIINKCLHRN